jgi:hypothetical protein
MTAIALMSAGCAIWFYGGEMGFTLMPLVYLAVDWVFAFAGEPQQSVTIAIPRLRDVVSVLAAVVFMSLLYYLYKWFPGPLERFTTNPKVIIGAWVLLVALTVRRWRILRRSNGSPNPSTMQHAM